MEALVQWFSHNLSQYISPEGAVFFISMIPLLELRGGLLAASLTRSDGNSPMYSREYYSHSLYFAFHQKDFQGDEKDKDFPGINPETGRPGNGKK